MAEKIFFPLNPAKENRCEPLGCGCRVTGQTIYSRNSFERNVAIVSITCSAFVHACRNIYLLINSREFPSKKGEV